MASPKTWYLILTQWHCLIYEVPPTQGEMPFVVIGGDGVTNVYYCLCRGRHNWDTYEV